MKDYERTRLQHILAELNRVTANCRDTMHEPDVTAVVTGFTLDNAFGESPYDNCGEFTVRLQRPNGDEEWFNLADLIALARTAQLPEAKS